ncbi:TPA: alanine racemase [Candidatus Ventrenecus stercoripullorum]|nr:alanine racemase [Candidatus Ventrenecus stercoripullorum]
MQRKTYAYIDGNILENNIKEIKKKYPDYKYYIGVVKNNAYHHGMKCVLDMIRGGINYFAVSSLEEALALRKYTDYPVLILEPISLEFVSDAINNNITLTVESLEYTKELLKEDIYSELKVHLAIDSGMNRLGFQTRKELDEALKLLKEHKKIVVEGLFTHFATSGVMDPHWDNQVKKFLNITKNIDFKEIPMVHLGRSLTLVNHPKLEYANAVRLGIIMYGFSQSRKEGTSLRSKLQKLKRNHYQKKYECSKTFLENDLKLNTAMSLYTEVISTRKVHVGDVVGYNAYPIKEDGYILTLPVGYADGVTKDYKEVAIESKRYKIVSDCMDMIMVYSETPIKIGTKVEIFGRTIPISSVTRRLGLNSYHLFNQISDRVVRVHRSNDIEEEITY